MDMGTVKVQVRQHKCAAVSQEPSLFAHTIYRSKRNFRHSARGLGPKTS